MSAVPRGRGRRAALIACATCCAVVASAKAIAAARSANGTCVASPSRNGAETNEIPVQMPVVHVPLDQLLQHEGGWRERGDELDPGAAGCIAASEGSERAARRTRARRARRRSPAPAARSAGSHDRSQPARARARVHREQRPSSPPSGRQVFRPPPAASQSATEADASCEHRGTRASAERQDSVSARRARRQIQRRRLNTRYSVTDVNTIRKTANG